MLLYADDIVIFAHSKVDLEGTPKTIGKMIKHFGLTIAEDKKVRSHKWIWNWKKLGINSELTWEK